MKFELSETDLTPIVEKVVEVAIKKLDETKVKLNGKIGLPEAQAAAALGIERHRLRDARRRGEITPQKIGKGYVYSIRLLQDWLEGGK